MSVHDVRINISEVECARDPLVRAFVLQEASGACECCEREAPFAKDDGSTFLEVHHLRTLANGGSDTPENAVAR